MMECSKADGCSILLSRKVRLIEPSWNEIQVQPSALFWGRRKQAEFGNGKAQVDLRGRPKISLNLGGKKPA